MNAMKVRSTTLGALSMIATALLPVTAAAQATALPGTDSEIGITTEAMFTIGAVDGPDWQSLGEIAGVAFDPSGNLYILDRQAAQVVVVSPRGELIRRIGRKGEGPGEFVMPSGLAILADGTVVVFDSARRNFTYLQADGTYIRSANTDFMEDAAIPLGTSRASGGRVLSEFRGLDIDTGNPASDPRNGDRILIRSLASSGWEANRVEMANPGTRASFVSRPGEQSMQIGGGPAFMPAVDWDVLPSGDVVWIDSDQWSIKVSSAPGSVRELTRPLRPRTASARDQNDERARRLEALESTGEGAPMMVEDVNGVRTVTRDTEEGRRMLAQLTFAQTIPVLSEIFVDHQGRIWARRAGDRIGESGPVDVIDPAGRYLGSFELDDLPVAVSPQGYAAFQEYGEFGVPVVRVVQIR